MVRYLQLQRGWVAPTSPPLHYNQIICLVPEDRSVDSGNVSHRNKLFFLQEL